MRRANLSGQDAPEVGLHIAVAGLLGVALPGDAWWSTIGHGWGKLTPQTAGILKAIGLKPGCPDIMIIWCGRTYFIELKRKKGGRVSDAQERAALAIGRAGASVAICRSVDEVVNALNAWGLPLRARIAV